MKYFLMCFLVTVLYASSFNEVAQLTKEGNLKRAKALTRLDAINQIPNAMYNQGLLEYATDSLDGAKRWFDRAADADVVQAKVAQAILFFYKNDNKNVLKVLKGVNTPLANDFRFVAEDRLHKTQDAPAKSYYHVGDIFYNDKVVKTEEKLAFELMKIAADKGNAQAQSKLGAMYRTGFAGQYQNNLLNALHYLELAQKSGVSDASFDMGMIYMQGPRGIRDVDKAMLLLKRASDEGSKKASAALAQFYYDGVGVSQVARNVTQAFHYASLSKERCNSKNLLAKMYRVGSGTQKNKKISQEYSDAFEKCSRDTHKDTQTHLPLLSY